MSSLAVFEAAIQMKSTHVIHQKKRENIEIKEIFTQISI